MRRLAGVAPMSYGWMAVHGEAEGVVSATISL